MDPASLQAIKNHMENILQSSVHDVIASLRDEVQAQWQKLLTQGRHIATS